MSGLSRRGTQRAASDGSSLIGRSPALGELRRRIERVGPTDATVLILGERGTGKELVARALAAASPRRARPFVAINCAALPPELLASELFGHERGAFTGATERRAGLLVAAQGGTVLLDEVGDLPPAGQAMLLRFLQEREVRPVGATTTLAVDVRVIAATNKDLEGAISRQEFRADLYDRLSEVVLEVPPLRERREDIRRLVEHFLALSSRRHGLPAPQINAGVMRLLERHPWPGNVRELEKAISRAVIFSEGGLVRAEDLEVPSAPEPVEDPAGEGVDPAADRAGGAALTARQREILRVALLHGSIRRRDVTERFGLSGETARRELVALARLGLLCRAGQRRGSRYFPGQGRGE